MSKSILNIFDESEIENINSLIEKLEKSSFDYLRLEDGDLSIVIGKNGITDVSAAAPAKAEAAAAAEAEAEAALVGATRPPALRVTSFAPKWAGTALDFHLDTRLTPLGCCASANNASRSSRRYPARPAIRRLPVE